MRAQWWLLAVRPRSWAVFPCVGTLPRTRIHRYDRARGLLEGWLHPYTTSWRSVGLVLCSCARSGHYDGCGGVRRRRNIRYPALCMR
ncbi:hypothetical protein BD413DRAFT_579122 [Trametes elegans]|nr:hypothetical protein BD413DRAFT_579122 [Trametes elegans]